MKSIFSKLTLTVASAALILTGCYKDFLDNSLNFSYIDYPGNGFYIKKINSDKLRTVYKFENRDRFLMKLMSFCLLTYDFLYERSLYSFRKSKDQKGFFKVLKK